MHGPTWEVKGEYKGKHKGDYNEISIIVIIAKDSKSQKLKLISAYPVNKIEKQQHLSLTLSK
ncbi:hypothetical protein [Rickettsiella endosymbiont of Rhagonycha lignosa]|uniref:hypothetical protein n=1 Tax=Rickettsiella endosymbiont of Rhagonycha lignosa TaxID=3077937 RepID=UPI00313D27E8